MFKADFNELRSAYGTATAFNGLGFDLRPVKAMAACFTLVRINDPDTLAPGPARFAPIAAPAGFQRMLLLGRETRGR